MLEVCIMNIPQIVITYHMVIVSDVTLQEALGQINDRAVLNLKALT